MIDTLYKIMDLAKVLGLWKPPRIGEPKPEEYKTHLTKTERHGKTYKELQELRKIKLEKND